jgi:hypothetical protein
MRRVPVGRLLWVVPLATAQQALERREFAVQVKRQEWPRRAWVPALVLLWERRRELLESLPWVVLLQITARTCPVRLITKVFGVK